MIGSVGKALFKIVLTTACAAKSPTGGEGGRHGLSMENERIYAPVTGDLSSFVSLSSFISLLNTDEVSAHAR